MLTNFTSASVCDHLQYCTVVTFNLYTALNTAFDTADVAANTVVIAAAVDIVAVVITAVADTAAVETAAEPNQTNLNSTRLTSCKTTILLRLLHTTITTNTNFITLTHFITAHFKTIITTFITDCCYYYNYFYHR